jgi:X-X-X-Leu-X-X-Gly heptad repeat protein
MAFDWKKKLDEGKKIASAAFSTAVEKIDELDAKYGPQVEAGVKKLEDKTAELADKVGQKIENLRGPKQG